MSIDGDVFVEATGSGGTGIQNGSTLTILEGEIRSVNIGIYLMNSQAILTLGSNDDALTLEDVRVVGIEVGVDNAAGGTFNFFNGAVYSKLATTMLKGDYTPRTDASGLAAIELIYESDPIEIHVVDTGKTETISYPYEIDDAYKVAHMAVAKIDNKNVYSSSINELISTDVVEYTGRAIRLLRTANEIVVVSGEYAGNYTDENPLYFRMNNLQLNGRIVNDGYLIIAGGAITSVDSEHSTIISNGYLELSNVKISSASDGENGAIENTADGKVVINQGTLILSSLGIINDGSLIFESGSISAAAGIVNRGVAQITGGTISGNVSYAIINYGELDVGVNDSEITESPLINSYSEFAAIFNGVNGDFKGVFNYYDGKLSSRAKYTYEFVSGSTYNHVGTEWTEMYDLSLRTILVDKVASVNDVKYDTLGEAIEAASDGDTVELLKNITVNSVNIAKNITLNMNGYSINHYFFTYTMESQYYFMNIHGNVTLNGGRIKNNTWKTNSVFMNQSGSLYLDTMYMYNNVLDSMNSGIRSTGTITMNSVDMSMHSKLGSITTSGTVIMNSGRINNTLGPVLYSAGGGVGNVVINGGNILSSTGGPAIANFAKVTIGDKDKELSQASPEITAFAGYAVFAIEVDFYNGLMISNNSYVYSSVDASSNKLREGHYIEYVENPYDLGTYGAYLVEGSIIDDDEELISSARIEGDQLLVTLNHPSRSVTSVNETLKVYLQPKGVGTFGLTCQTTGTQSVCTQSKLTFENVSPYLYNLTYDDALVIYYENSIDGRVVAREIVNRDLHIVKYLDEIYTKVVGSNEVISDGELIMINLLSGTSSINVDDQALKEAIFGSHLNSVVSSSSIANISGITSYTGENAACVGDGLTGICKKSVNASFVVNSTYPVPSNTSIDVIIYDFTPKLVDASGNAIESLSNQVCEYGKECNVEALSFKDVNGKEITNLMTYITLNGKAVNSIDTSVLGNYVVTTVAIDDLGNYSSAIVREYNVVDNRAPIAILDEGAIVIKKGHTFNYNEVFAFDNYDEDLKVERITSDINFNKAGEYKVGYRVTDSSGNSVVVYRDVIITDSTNTLVYVIGLVAVVSLLGFVLLRRKYTR